MFRNIRRMEGTLNRGGTTQVTVTDKHIKKRDCTKRPVVEGIIATATENK